MPRLVRSLPIGDVRNRGLGAPGSIRSRQHKRFLLRCAFFRRCPVVAGLGQGRSGAARGWVGSVSGFRGAEVRHLLPREHRQAARRRHHRVPARGAAPLRARERLDGRVGVSAISERAAATVVSNPSAACSLRSRYQARSWRSSARASGWNSTASRQDARPHLREHLIGRHGRHGPILKAVQAGVQLPGGTGYLDHGHDLLGSKLSDLPS